MDKYVPALLASLLLATVPSALAGSQTDLRVTGAITPKACITGLSNDGVIDHGKVTVRDLNPDRHTLLPPQLPAPERAMRGLNALCLDHHRQPSRHRGDSQPSRPGHDVPRREPGQRVPGFEQPGGG
ncbi:DUF1120 domain-containing protein [Pseudomonas simiae]